MPPYPLLDTISVPAYFSETDSIRFGDLTWWNVESYLENMKNGVQTMSQFVTGCEKYVYI